MCKVRDIILVDNYVSGGKNLSKHSFVVVSDESGKIGGLSFDMVCNVMSSFKDEKQKQKKLSYPGNFPITHNDTVVTNDNGKSGYIKTEQLYYFKKEKINYTVIGEVKEEIFDLLIEFIENELDISFEDIMDNL